LGFGVWGRKKKSDLGELGKGRKGQIGLIRRISGWKLGERGILSHKERKELREEGVEIEVVRGREKTISDLTLSELVN